MPMLGWGISSALMWPGFHPRSVRVLGAHVVPEGEIRILAHINMHRNIWLINPWSLSQRVEAIPYVATAKLQRQLPNIVSIEIIERRPEGCVLAAQHATLLIDAAQRILSTHCPPLVNYKIPTLLPLRSGATLENSQLTRLRTAAALLLSEGMHFTALQLDRDNGLVAERTDGLQLLFGDDNDLLQKARLVAPILAAAHAHDPHVEQIDLRMVDTPVVRYRESHRGTQNALIK